MGTPQAGIFTEGHRCLHTLEYTLKPDASTDALATTLQAAIKAVHATEADAVFAFGPTLWARIARDRMPHGFTDFQPLDGPKAHAPATQRDILVWLHGAARDQVMDAALAADAMLSTIAERQLDLSGFVYHDSRDLTGFVDGSANATDLADRKRDALVPEGQPGAGGAIILSQKWVHNLPKFKALAVTDQENVIGRTKPDSVEMEPDVRPVTAHVSRTDLNIQGVAQKMYRRSFPYGTPSEHGLYFLAFTCDQSRFDNVLASMYGLSEDGVTDHLLDFSTPVTGSYWFAPSQEDLEAALA